jgi:beta-glucanase (GH16 family)
MLPYGKGTWPAFWMLPLNPADPWPKSGEIDILEAVNLSKFTPTDFKPSDYVQSNLHFCSGYAYFPVDPNASGTAQNDCKNWDGSFNKVHRPMTLQMGTHPGKVPNLTGAFHTYAMEWSESDMRFFVDDQLIGQTLHGPDSKSYAPFRSPFYLIINLAIGGNMPGAPDRNTWALDYRVSLLIDWVRVYACAEDLTAKKCIFRGTGLGKA